MTQHVLCERLPTAHEVENAGTVTIKIEGWADWHRIGLSAESRIGDRFEK
jgi:hypothetical protein